MRLWLGFWKYIDLIGLVVFVLFIGFLVIFILFFYLKKREINICNFKMYFEVC